MMRFKVMGSRHGLAVALAAGFGCLVATASPATEPIGPAGPPLRLKPGAPPRFNTIPLFAAPSLDLVDVADAITHEPVRDESGAVVCLAGCIGPRGMVVHVAHGPAWHVASINAPSHEKPRPPAAAAPLVAECIAGCDRKPGVGNERPGRTAGLAGVVRLPERAANTPHDYGRAPISVRRHLVSPRGGRQQQAGLSAGGKTGLGKRRGATWAIAQRPVRLR